MECAICFNSLIKSGEEGSASSANNESEELCCTPCGHVYHFGCLRTWFQNNQSCPNCRVPVFADGVRKIYLPSNSGRSDSGSSIGKQEKKECPDCTKLKEDVDKLKDSKETLKNHTKLLTDARAADQQELERLNATLDKLRTCAQSHFAQNFMLLEGQRKDKEEILGLTYQINNWRKLMEDSEKEKRSLMDGRQRDQELIRDLMSQLDSLRTNQEALQARITWFLANEKSHEEEVDELNKRNQLLKSENESLSRMRELFKKQANAKIDSFRRLVDNFKAQRDYVEECHRFEKQKVAELTAEVESLRNEIKTLDCKLKNVESDFLRVLKLEAEEKDSFMGKLKRFGSMLGGKMRFTSEAVGDGEVPAPGKARSAAEEASGNVMKNVESGAKRMRLDINRPENT